MADRRMFSKKILNSAKFLKMPSSSRLLYYDLGLNADDDGVVEAYNIIRMNGCTEDDLKILVAKEYVLVLNEDLVSYITDWHEHNSIRSDRKIDSIYKNLLLQIVPDTKIIEKRPRADSKKLIGQPMDNQRTADGQPTDGIGKDRLGKDKIVKNNIDTVIDEFTIGSNVLAVAIHDFVSMRKQIKKPLTDRALSLMLKKLSGMTSNVEHQIAILNQSTMNSWQGIFEVKEPIVQEKKGEVIKPDNPNRI